MADIGCGHVRDVAAELALGILPGGEQPAVASHLEACATCREEVGAMEVVAARLLELVPGTEPPLGFDHRVLARVSGSSRRLGARR
ncbi:MAG: hypothetical protein ACRDYY_10005, partial [Acidimicrobiales bacterium]